MSPQAARRAVILWPAVLVIAGCHGPSLGQRRADAAPPAARLVSREVTIGRQVFRYQVYLPPGYTKAHSWPVILSLHGAGECGTDNRRPAQAALGAAAREYPSRYPCVIVFPQTRSQTAYWSRDQAQALAALAQTVQQYHGDPRRLYLTGYSLGGAGSWYLAATHPGLFAALVPISPRAAVRPDRVRRNPAVLRLAVSRDPYAAVAARVSRMPIWIFHGQDDPIVPVSESRRMSAALAVRHAHARFTIYADVGHDAWDRAYTDPALPRWLLSQRLPAH